MNITKIYLVTNCYGDPNKVYIGKTKNCRKYDHKFKFGKDIIYEEIDRVNSLNKKEWEPLETFWIEYFRQLGFNIQNKRMKGGSGPEFCSSESKLKIGKANKGKLSKTVLQYDLEGNFIMKHESVYLANKYLNISPTKTSISSCCLGKTKTCYNYIWRYEKDSKLPTEIQPEHKTKNNIVYQFSTNKILIKKFDNVYKASKQTNIASGNILACCYNKTKTAGGFIWSFEEKIEELNLDHKRKKCILQYDLDGNFIREWSSSQDASIFYTGSYKLKSRISKNCKGLINKSYGYIWKFKN